MHLLLKALDLQSVHLCDLFVLDALLPYSIGQFAGLLLEGVCLQPVLGAVLLQLRPLLLQLVDPRVLLLQLPLHLLDGLLRSVAVVLQGLLINPDLKLAEFQPQSLECVLEGVLLVAGLEQLLFEGGLMLHCHVQLDGQPARAHLELSDEGLVAGRLGLQGSHAGPLVLQLGSCRFEAVLQGG
jgi:hypothetical protein